MRFAFVFLLLAGFAKAQSGGGLDFTKMLKPNPEKHIFRSEDYFIWCNGVVKGDDNKFHMFYSRWPLARGYDAWVTHSEVAHAISDSLLGPYEFSDVSLPARGNSFWDGDYTHNPHVLKVDSVYYLYYTGNYGSGYWYDTPNDRKPVMNDEEWWVNRNNQRVGVAVADNPYGPWRRFNRPLIDTIPGRITTGVPTVSVRHDGKYMMVYKSVIGEPGVKQGVVQHYVAISDSPLGPFIDYPEPFIKSQSSDFPIDDHVEWYQDDRYYCIVKDHSPGKNTNKYGGYQSEHGRALILYESMNGFDWQLSENVLVQKFEITFSDSTYYKFDRLEMPKVYLESGKVKALFLAGKIEGEQQSFSVALSIDDIPY